MAGLGTKDYVLVYLSAKFFHHMPSMKMDLRHDIKQAYQSRYGKSLVHRVEGETSGDYKKALVALISK